MSAVLYREAGAEDLEAVQKLWSQLDDFHHQLGMSFPESGDAAAKWQASFQRTLGRFSHLWIAESEGAIAAFLLGRVKQSPAFLGGVQVGEISDLFVSDSLRGQGVGGELVRMAMLQFAEAKLHSVEVQIQAGNDAGLEFWKEQGFDLDLTQVRKVL